MTTASDITALKTRCAAIEARNRAQDTTIAALTARIAKLEAVKPFDPAALTAAVADLASRIAALEAAEEPPAPPPPAPQPPGVFNVLDYGAHRDGKTDDVGHINAAIDACSAAGGGTVYLPAGVYAVYAGTTINPDCYGQVVLKDDVHLRGDGPATVLYNTRLAAGCNVVAAHGRSNISASDFAVHQVAGTTSGNGVKFYACKTVLVENVLAYENPSEGIALYSVQGGVIRGCVCHHNGNSGITIGEARLDFQRGFSVSVEDCECYANKTGFRTYGQLAQGKRLMGVTFNRCRSHGQNAAWYHTYVGDLNLSECVGEGSSSSHFNMFLCNVAGAHIHSSTTPTLITSANDNTAWTTWGSTDCTGVVED